MKEMLKRFVREEEGLETVEYALMLVLIALAAIITATALGGAISKKFGEATTAIGG
jgi:pilus assembly protein Flp/PilA